MTKNLQDNTELPKLTARRSLSMPSNASSESMDCSAVLTSTLHRRTSKEFKAAEVLPQGEYHINTHTHLPDRIGQTYKAENSLRGGSSSFKVYDVIHRHVDGMARKLVSFLNTCFPIVKPHDRVVQWWNRFFVISCLVAIFVDPLFFFLLSVEKENKCIIFHWPMAIAIAIVRSITDFFYLLHIFLQVMILAIIPNYVGPPAANLEKNLLCITVLQYIYQGSSDLFHCLVVSLQMVSYLSQHGLTLPLIFSCSYWLDILWVHVGTFLVCRGLIIAYVMHALKLVFLVVNIRWSVDMGV